MKRIRIIILLLAVIYLCPQVGVAASSTAIVNGIAYYIYPDEKTAEVTYFKSMQYPVDIVIPERITVDGQSYTVTKVRSGTFENFPLKSIVLPKTIQEIGAYAFNRCSNLKSINLPEGLITIGSSAFEKCPLTSITFPKNLETIMGGAFKDCPIASVSLPKSLKKLGGGVFSGCSITTISLPNSLTDLDDFAFSGCNLISAEIHCAKVSDQLFSKMTTLTIVVLGNEVTEIGKQAFFGCESLSSINLPQNLKTIGKSAFSGCKSLESITLPENIESLGENVFYQAGLKSAKIYCPIVSRECFYNNDLLEEVAFGNEVREIGLYSFDDCDALKSIVIPEGVTLIRSQAFYSCDSMETITLPKSLQKIETYAFSELGKLQSITAHMRTPPVCGSNFGNRYKEATLYVPYGKVPVYKRTNNWKNFLNIVELPSEPGDVTGLTLNKQEATLMLGQSEQLIANIIPANANDKSVTWTTSNKSVATVDADGTVKALKLGTVTITCTSVDNETKTGTCIVTVVPVPVENVTLNKTSAELFIGSTEQLIATVFPADATYKDVTWKSSDVNIATVTTGGLVRAISEGTATVTCTSNTDATKIATCNVTIKPIRVATLTISNTTLSMIVGNTQTLKATIKPADATHRDVTWTTSDSSIATVSVDGMVKAIAKGTAIITCTSNDNPDISATCTVNVGIIGVTKITLNKTSLEVEENWGETLTATVFPSNASDKSVVWESSDTTVATVERGLVHPQLHGECVITCRSVSNPEVYASCKVTVKAWIVNFFVIPSEIGVTESWTNPEITLVISTKDPRVIWTSMDESIATVDERGYVTGIKAGKTKVVCTSVADPTRFITRDVEVYPAQIVIEKPLLIMNVGDQDTLKHYVYHPDYASQEVTWSSSDTNIATVDTAGLVTAVGGGRALITATWKWNSERKESRIVYVSPVLTPAIPPTKVFGEYFFDRDPGYGKASSLPMAAWGSSDYALSTAGIAPGAHILYLRCRDEYGRWSATVSRPMCVLSYPDIVAAEYFFDNESAGIGQRKPITLPDGKFRELTFDVETEGLTPGRHQLTVRIMDKFGRWSIASSEPITVTKSGTGIATVTTDFAIAINATRGRCTLSDLDLGNRNNCRVEIYDAAGRTLAVTLWKRAETEKALPVSAAEGSVLVVKVSDTANGRQLTRRIIVK